MSHVSSVDFVVLLTAKPLGLLHHTIWCLRCSSTCTANLSSSALANCQTVEADVLNFSNTKLCGEVTLVWNVLEQLKLVHIFAPNIVHCLSNV